jgi:hypothetical protein
LGFVAISLRIRHLVARSRSATRGAAVERFEVAVSRNACARRERTGPCCSGPAVSRDACARRERTGPCRSGPAVSRDACARRERTGPRSRGCARCCRKRRSRPAPSPVFPGGWLPGCTRRSDRSKRGAPLRSHRSGARGEPPSERLQDTRLDAPSRRRSLPRATGKFRADSRVARRGR